MTTTQYETGDTVKYRGLAATVLRYSDDEAHDGRFVRITLVGDDAVHVVDVDDIEPVEEGEYCGGCGQIGCAW